MTGSGSHVAKMGFLMMLVASLWSTAQARTGAVKHTSGCYITTVTCPLFPTKAGTFRETLAAAHGDPAQCLARAQSHYNQCGTTLFVTASFYADGALQASTTYHPLGYDGTSQVRETLVFQQESVSAIGDHVRAGYSIPGTTTHITVGLDGATASHLYGKMELSMPMDRHDPQPPKTSPGPSQLTFATGVNQGWPLPHSAKAYQATVKPNTPGSTGVLAYGGEIGMSLQARSCSVNWDYNKCPVVMTYRLPIGQPYYPFRGHETDQLEYTFDLKIPTVSGFGDVKGNVNVYLNFSHRHNWYPGSDPQTNPNHGKFGISYGAAVFHTDPGNSQLVWGDSESGNMGVAVLLGNPQGSGATPAYALQHEQTATYSVTSSFEEYRTYRFVIDSFTMRNLLTKINRTITENPQHFNRPLYPLNPADYQLDEVVVNPELYVPGPRTSTPPPAHLALSFKNLRVKSYQSHDVKGAIEGVTQSNGTTYVHGWACAFSKGQSIDVDLYAGGPRDAGGRYVAAATANLAHGSDVAHQCGTTGVSHGFSIPIPANKLTEENGQPLFVHGVSPVGLPRLPLKDSGLYLVSSSPSVMIARATAYRFVSGSDRFFSLSATAGNGFGYTQEGGLFQISNTNNDATQAIYQCHQTAGGAHFLSTDSACEGQTQDYTLGYVFKKSVPGMRPLYRFRYSSGHSLETTEYGEGAFNGLTFEAILGYVW